MFSILIYSEKIPKISSLKYQIAIQIKTIITNKIIMIRAIVYGIPIEIISTA